MNDQFLFGFLDRIGDITTHIYDDPRMIGSSPMPNIKHITLGVHGICAEDYAHQDK
jgi:hypothetical protein